MNNKNTTYGSPAKASEIEDMLHHLIKTNRQIVAKGRAAIPLCIWGAHGIGKTALVEGFAQKHQYQWAYIAPAQLEEMGDLLGMPRIQDDQTVFAAPAWVPTETGPGILLIDDVNRADDRILQGIMQLLQNQALVSWQMPRDWHIVLTANPDNGDYSVTPLDEAMLTRMMHVTMIFDAEEWIRWAESEEVDARGINFVMTHPQLIQGHRSNPRSLTYFFESIQSIESLHQQKALIQLLGDANLDPDTTTAFLQFIETDLGKIPPAPAILNTNNFQEEVYEPLKQLATQELLRVDLLAAIGDRLIRHIQKEPAKLRQKELENLKSFLTIDFLPADLRLLFSRELIRLPSPKIKGLFADPQLAQLLL